MLPLGFDPSIGLGLAAHYYNSSIKWHGRNEAVINTKKLDPDQRKALVYDIERGKSQEIQPYAWQTDTCIGSWHYDRRIYDNHRYKTAAQVVPMLIDIVSKNGNLLLSIPVRGDGTIDSDEVKVLEDIAAWIAVNGEAIYATRPWKVYGEGPSTAPQEANVFGGVKDVGSKPFTPADIRFTTRGDTLYAFAMAWPADGKLTIHALANGNGTVQQVSLLGHPGNLDFKQTAQGLEITLPSKAPCNYAVALKINGSGLTK